MEILSQFGTLPAVTALLLAIAVVIRALRGVIRDVLNFRLERRALKRKKKAPKALRALAKVIAAQRGKRWWRRKKEAPKVLPHDQTPTFPSGSPPPNPFDQRPAA
jgi:hypothetical protein